MFTASLTRPTARPQNPRAAGHSLGQGTRPSSSEVSRPASDSARLPSLDGGGEIGAPEAALTQSASVAVNAVGGATHAGGIHFEHYMSKVS